MSDARKFFGWLIALAAMLSVARGSDFDVANQAYEAGKFEDARERYEQLVKRGEWSANLFYNLGNAQFRLGAPGRAIVNYERALALEPSHAEAIANLRLLREKTGARLPAPKWSDHVVPALPTNVFVVFGAIAGWMGLAALLAIFFIRGAATANVWMVVAVCVLGAGYAAVAIWQRSGEAALAIVTAPQVDARLAPADRAGVAEPLPAGSRVRVLRERGEWVYCALPGNGLGWLPAKAIEKVRLSRS